MLVAVLALHLAAAFVPVVSDTGMRDEHSQRSVTLDGAAPEVNTDTTGGSPERPEDPRARGQAVKWLSESLDAAKISLSEAWSSALPSAVHEEDDRENQISEPSSFSTFTFSRVPPSHRSSGMLIAVTLLASGVLLKYVAQVPATDILILFIYLSTSLTLEFSIILSSQRFPAGALPYRKEAVLVCVELLKLVVSAVLFLLTRSDEELTRSDIAALAGSGGLYSLNNWLLFATLETIQPQIYGVVRDTNLVFTALFWTLVFNVGLGLKRWAAILLIVAGAVVVQLPDLNPDGASNNSLYLAFLLTFCNAMATVLNEKALKRNSKTDINLQNVVLYSFCTVFNGAFGVIHYGQSFVHEFFHGMDDRMILFIIVVQCMIGLLVSRILKHQSSVLKNVVTPLRTMSFLLSVPLVTGSDVSLAALCAGTLGIAGTFLYLGEGPLPKPGAAEPIKNIK